MCHFYTDDYLNSEVHHLLQAVQTKEGVGLKKQDFLLNSPFNSSAE